MSSLIRKTFPVPPLSCNCSIVGDADTKQAVVVDPGGNPERILEEIESLGLTVCAILHTHAHLDHFLASGQIKKATGAPLCLHPQDKDLWNMLEIQCQLFIFLFQRSYCVFVFFRHIRQLSNMAFGLL